MDIRRLFNAKSIHVEHDLTHRWGEESLNLSNGIIPEVNAKPQAEFELA